MQPAAPGSTLQAALRCAEEIRKVPTDSALLCQAQQAARVCYFYSAQIPLSSVTLPTYFHGIS